MMMMMMMVMVMMIMYLLDSTNSVLKMQYKGRVISLEGGL